MYVTGAGFEAGCTVVVRITRPDGSVITGDGNFTPGSDVVFTGEDGSLYYEYILNGSEGTYTVDVLGAGDVVLATTTFTDGVVGGSIGWEKRVHSDGDLDGGATFTVGGANGAPSHASATPRTPSSSRTTVRATARTTTARSSSRTSVPARTR